MHTLGRGLATICILFATAWLVERTMARSGSGPTASHGAEWNMPAMDGDQIQFAGGVIRIDFDDAEFDLSRKDLVDWVRQSARATATYFGRFPVPYVRIVIEPARGSEVLSGRAVGRPEPKIVVTIGRHVTRQQLADESLLVHEMTHLAIPDHDIRHLWLHEGIATYVELVARAQAGLMRAEDVWNELLRELPAGLPAAGEHGGLDDTHSEGRRYWGGALFCLLADLDIRRNSGNKLGLQDALRTLHRQGGNLSRVWSLERTLAVGDEGTGTSVLRRLYQTMGNRPYAPDLERLWRELGIRRDHGRIVLDDAAPLSAARRAITQATPQPVLVAAPRLVRVVDGRDRSR